MPLCPKGSIVSLIGPRDESDSNKSSLEKRAPGSYRDATELFNQHIEGGRMSELVEKVFDAWDRGLSSDNDKLAVDTAAKFTKAFYNPDKKVIIEGGPSAEQIHMNIMLQQDSLNDKDKAVLKRFSSFLSSASEAEIPNEEIIEAEVISDDSMEEPDGRG